MTQTADPTADYTAQLAVDAAPAAVFAALTTTTGLGGWWTAWTSVTGTGDEGGDVRFSFGGDDQLVVHVDAARPTVVAWSVEECAVLPDWAGTRPTFTMRPRPGGGTEINFHHIGLAPALECFGECRKGWDQYLANLQAYLATT
jgi:uncharacterized protein YndB with AHSA1/START domain